MIFDEPSRKPLPSNPELADHRTAVIKGALGAIPVLGNVFAEELGLLLAPPLTQRRDAWLEDLARRLKDLEGRIDGFRFEDLASNEQFVSATVQATQAAVKTHQKEKLEALRNAVMNVALDNKPQDAHQAVFLDLVDRFTPLHLKLLRFFQDPDGHIKSRGVQIPPERFRQPVYLLLLECLPEVSQASPSVDGREAARGQFVDVLMKDLARASLISIDLTAFKSPPGYPRWTTHLGDDFLDFIKLPDGART